MPSLSGLHMWRTTSSGHSSRASRSINTSSGRRFLANSRRDLRLSLSVLLAIMTWSSLCGNALHFTNFVRQFGQELQNVVNNSHVSHLKDRSFWILVDRDDEGISLNAGEMLERSADPACQVDLGLGGLAGRTNLARFLQPLGIHDRP